MKNMKNKGVYIGLVAIVLAFAVPTVLISFQEYEDPIDEPVYSPMKIRTPYDDLSTGYRLIEDNDSDYGIIEGSINYPSEYIPDDLIICANPVGNVGDDSEFCTTEHMWGMAYGPNHGYELLVPEGLYFMSVERPDYEILGLYTEWVECNRFYDPLSYSYDDERCDSHAQIPVVVVAGQMVNGVDLVDYYHY